MKICPREASEGVSYSLRSTSTGSSREAARAGSRQARSATASSTAGTTTKVAGSLGFTAYSKVAAKRVTPSAARGPLCRSTPA